MNITFLKAFSAYPTTPMSVTDYAVGILHPRQEVLALLPVLSVTGKSSAAAFAVADTDLDLLVSTFVSKVRASYMGLSDAINQVPDVIRDIADYGLGGDFEQLDAQIRNAATITAVGGTAQVIKIPLAIPFINVQKEHMNLNAFSAGQLIQSARVDLDVINVGLPATVVFLNGSFVASAIAGELWALTGAIRPVLWMAPAQKSYQRGATSVTVEAEGGPLFDEIVFANVDAATFPNSNDNVQIVIDGKTYVFQTAVKNLPLAFSATVKANLLGVPGYDMAQNSKNNAGTRKGRTPFVWLPGNMHPIEAEYPVAASGRSINFGPKTTSAPNLCFWRQTAITSQENLSFLATMLQDPRLQPYFSERALSADQIQQVKNLAFGDLAVYGGGSGGPGSMNSDLSLFKARYFAPAG